MSKMFNMKKATPYIIIVLLVSIVIAAYPEVIKSVPNFFGAPKDCSVDSFDKHCTCAPDETRQRTSYRGIPRYYCEKTELFIDPSSSDWEQQAINHFEEYLAENYPDCNMIHCNVEGSGAKYWLASGLTQYDDVVKKTVSIECKNDFEQRIFSKGLFSVDTGEFFEGYQFCADYYQKPIGETNIDVEFEGNPINDDEPWLPHENSIDVQYSWRADCEKNGLASSGEIIYKLPDGVVATDAAILYGEGRIVDVNGDEVRFVIEHECGGPTSRETTLRIFVDENSVCRIDSHRFYKNGDYYCRGRRMPGEHWFDVFRCNNGEFSRIGQYLNCDDSESPGEYSTPRA